MHIHIHSSRIHLSKRYRGLRRDSGGEHALLIEIEILKSQLYSHLIGYLLVVHWLLSICFTPGRQRGRAWCVYVKAFVSALWVYVLGGNSEGERDVCMCMHIWVYCECMYSRETARKSVMCVCVCIYECIVSVCTRGKQRGRAWCADQNKKSQKSNSYSLHLVHVVVSWIFRMSWKRPRGRTRSANHNVRTFSKVSDNVPKSQ